MSTNPQWKTFQPAAVDVGVHQDAALLDFKSMAANGKPTQPYGSSANNRSNSTSRYGHEFPLLQDKPYGGGGGNHPYGSSGATARFPAVGTFSALDAGGGAYTSGGDSTGGGGAASSPYSNGGGYSGDSNSANLGTRETGIIEKLLHSYGFIQCCERQARLFFHFSQFSGNIEHLKIGDPVEFEMTYDRRTGKPIASAVTKIAPDVVMSEERVTGGVTTELRPEGATATGDSLGRISYENRGECFFLPYGKDDVEGHVVLRAGDRVSFQIATNRRGNLGACHVRLENPAHPVRYQGVVCSMKESFGFIERADVVKEIFFHFSEARVDEELRPGDDVEFAIQTRNGKEVACGITRLDPGAVIFEDVGPDIVKGQVLKPLDRCPSTTTSASRHQSAPTAADALPGRIRYRAPDRSEGEIAFGERDQRGDFTLRHGDWVRFKIATDRRDQLRRATRISLLDESFVVSGERRERGTVASLRDGFGFVRCAEREPRLFFHFSEVLDVDEEEIQVGDEFEFTVVQDQSGAYGSTGRQSAIRMKRLPGGSVQFETLVESDVVGHVTKEAAPRGWVLRSPAKTTGSNGEQQPDSGLIACGGAAKRSVAFHAKDCDAKEFPRLGDKVQFNLSQVKRSKELVAVDVQVLQAAHQANGAPAKQNTSVNRTNPQVYQGFVAALKDGFGFIETAQHNREVFFHFSNFEGEASALELGQEVEYNLGGREKGSCSSAENVRVVPRGTIDLPPLSPEIRDGSVVRPIRSVNPDQSEYSGLIRVVENSEEDAAKTQREFEFGISGLWSKRELLQAGDAVQFQVDASGRAGNVRAVRKRHRATVDAIKGAFGFLAYEVDEGKKLFFHMSEVREAGSGSGGALQVGDMAEFVLVTNQRNGKSSACNIVKVGDSQARPERLISRLRTVSLDDAGPRLTVIRQPKGPDATSKGFLPAFRVPRTPGSVPAD